MNGQGITTSWVTLTRRTEDPKLTCIERTLDALAVPHRRKGDSAHAPILQVDARCKDVADAVVDLVDDIPDHHKSFKEMAANTTKKKRVPLGPITDADVENAKLQRKTSVMRDALRDIRSIVDGMPVGDAATEAAKERITNIATVHKS